MTARNLAGLQWRKSRHSGSNANCVEVAATPHQMAVRDSKNPDGPALLLSLTQWASFLDTIKHA